MFKIGILFPHQLFEEHAILTSCDRIYLIESYLFFNQYKFHKQKLAFHRATMKAYASYLTSQGLDHIYVSSFEEISDVRVLIPKLVEGESIDELHFIDPTDQWVSQRIKASSQPFSFDLITYEDPHFLTTSEDLGKFFRTDKKSFFQTTFYKQQRKRLGVLLAPDGSPMGGKWTYDSQNRKKYPKGKVPPSLHFPPPNPYWSEALEYVEEYFSHNPGEVRQHPIYPVTYEESLRWLQQFLEFRFYHFGDYEDAIVKEQFFLHHSVLSPLLNVGLLKPQHVLEHILTFATSENIPINSTEGFVRQLIGWREFIRGMYECKGIELRTRNYWGFTRKIPASFYSGTTGIEPVDQTIKKVLQTGYCHHIERLMILGNFMLLCEFDPDDIYQWFMELFIDAYDWVMVPNVYGMSQFADGGLFATKPYISGSNYIKKMSNYKTGNWQQIWDGLFWRFIHMHQDFFQGNPRMNMLWHTYNRMTDEKRQQHLVNAKQFLDTLA